jgi:hypothetical protein
MVRRLTVFKISMYTSCPIRNKQVSTGNRKTSNVDQSNLINHLGHKVIVKLIHELKATQTTYSG